MARDFVGEPAEGPPVRPPLRVRIPLYSVPLNLMELHLQPEKGFESSKVGSRKPPRCDSPLVLHKDTEANITDERLC